MQPPDESSFSGDGGFVPEPSLGPRIESTLDQVGIGNRMLVAFGGHLPDGELAQGGPLVCDTTTQRWHPLPFRPEAEDHSAEPRSSHATAVMGENRSLLIVCGGEGETGALFGDLKVLEMRTANDAPSVARRREERTARERGYEDLCAMRVQASNLRRQLTHATRAAQQAAKRHAGGHSAEKIRGRNFDSASAARRHVAGALPLLHSSPVRTLNLGIQQKLDALVRPANPPTWPTTHPRGRQPPPPPRATRPLTRLPCRPQHEEVDRLRHEDRETTRELASLFDLLEEQLERAQCDWQWLPVQVAISPRGRPMLLLLIRLLLIRLLLIRLLLIRLTRAVHCLDCSDDAAWGDACALAPRQRPDAIDDPRMRLTDPMRSTNPTPRNQRHVDTR